MRVRSNSVCVFIFRSSLRRASAQIFLLLLFTPVAFTQSGDPQSQLNRGLTLIRSGRLPEAVAPLQKAAADPGLAGQAHFLLGLDYFESKQYDHAAAELSRTDVGGPREQALYMLEECYRRTGHVEQAKATFHTLLTQYPDSAWTHYLMGTAYEDQHQLEKALDEYRAAAQKDPGLPNINFSVGYVYFREGNIPAAQQWLSKEAAKGCHSLANFYLGEIARSNSQLQTAETLYRRATSCDRGNADAHLRLGMVYESEKRYPLAVAELREAIRFKPDLAAPHYHLASVYREMGRKADSETEFAKVRRIEAASDNGVDVTKEKEE